MAQAQTEDSSKSSQDAVPGFQKLLQPNHIGTGTNTNPPLTQRRRPPSFDAEFQPVFH